MLKIKHVAVCMLALAMLSAGCTNYSGNTYSGSQVRSAQTVQYGTVVSVQPVTLEEDRPAVLGTVGGGVVGGVLGNMVGGGRGKTLATIAGAALGAAGGYAGEKALTKQNGMGVGASLHREPESQAGVHCQALDLFPGYGTAVVHCSGRRSAILSG